jgi:hypothetical protein
MIVRKFEEADYDQVALLIKSCKQGILPQYSDLGGYGVVIEEDLIITGFVWALTSPDSTIVYVEYFAVAEEKRNQKIHGPMLMTKLIYDLAKMGKSKICGILKDGASYSESLSSIYKDVGMEISQGFVVSGDAKTILDGINSRYRGVK